MFAGLVREESRFVLLSGPEAQCNEYHLTANLSYVDICNFVNSTADCQSDDGFINYLNVIYCSLAGGFEMSLFCKLWKPSRIVLIIAKKSPRHFPRYPVAGTMALPPAAGDTLVAVSFKRLIYRRR